MEVKPGYKQTEIGVIPEDWEVFSLSELTDPRRPISYGIVQTGPNVANGVRCLRVLDINEGRINKAGLITTAKQTSESYRRTVLMPGDLVMPLRGKVGDVGLVDEELKGANLTRGVALIAIRSVSSPEYCQQIISAPSTRRRLEQAMNGSALQEIPIASLRSFKIPAPKTLIEQRAIAEALSDADGLLGGLDRLIAKKRDLKQAAMQQLLTGQTRLPGFHGEWDVEPFAAVLARLNAKAHQIQTSDYQSSGRYPVVDQGKEAVIGFSDNEEKRLRCPAGGVIVFGDHTCIVKFIDFDFLVGADGTQILQGKTGQNTRFHALQLQYRGIDSTGYNRHFKFLKEREYVVPPLPEQTAIAQVLTEMDAELAALEQRREKTRALKQAMMQELLTGRTRLV
jgi:type I restriction enzyme, S subunit